MVNEKEVSKLSTYLRSLAKSRRSKVVTADDVHKFLDTKTKVSKNATRKRLSYINSALREPNFYAIGEVASARPAARGRMITEWSLA